MWWNRQVKASELPAALEERLRSVEKTQEAVDSTVRKLKLEWEDVYDRIERIVARINARSRSERRAAEDAPANTAPSTVDDLNEAIRRGLPIPNHGRR